MSAKKYDPREQFKGDDPSKYIRALAKGMLEQGEAAARRKEQLLSAYTSRPTLEVRITHVRDDPPLWRLETVSPVVVHSRTGVPERITVVESQRNLLIPELRYRVAQKLLEHGYARLSTEEAAGLTPQQKSAASWAKARELATGVNIEERGVIQLLDSERFSGERRR